MAFKTLGDEPLFKFTTEGEQVIGKLLTLTPNQGRKQDSTICEVETKDGTVLKFFASKIVQDRLKEEHVGKVIRLTFNGKKKSASGNQYNDIKVEIDE